MVKGIILGVSLALLPGCLTSIPASHVGFRCDSDAQCDAASGCVGHVCREGGHIPNAANTGVPPGVVLMSSSGLVLATAGAVIDGLDITGCVEIHANDVTLRRSRVRCSGADVVRLADETQGTLLEDVELDGLDGGWSNGVAGAGSATLERVNIHGVYSGVALAAGTVVQNSYVHDLVGAGGNAFFLLQGSNVTLDNDHCDVADKQTSCIFVSAQNADINGVTVKRSLLNGGGITAYFDDAQHAATNIRVESNRFGRGYGYGLFQVTSTSITFSDNVWDDTSTPVPTP